MGNIHSYNEKEEQKEKIYNHWYNSRNKNNIFQKKNNIWKEIGEG